MARLSTLPSDQGEHVMRAEQNRKVFVSLDAVELRFRHDQARAKARLVEYSIGSELRFGHVQAIHSHTGTAASPAHSK